MLIQAIYICDFINGKVGLQVLEHYSLSITNKPKKNFDNMFGDIYSLVVKLVSKTVILF